MNAYAATARFEKKLRKEARGRKQFNVWIHVEKQDIKTGDGTDIALPDKLATFATQRAAEKFAFRIVEEYADDRTIETSEFRPPIKREGRLS